MSSKIIVDSCCDLTPEMKQEMGITSVPCYLRLGDKEFCDDDLLDRAGFMNEMHHFPGKASSAAPSPLSYQEAIEQEGDTYVVTLSRKISSSYGNAVIGIGDAVAAGKPDVCLLDTKSASAGETLVVIKLYELIRANLPKEEILGAIQKFIDGMKTFFVLENYDNLQKNGRISKVTGSLIHLLNIKLIMGADGQGEIALFEKCRGKKKMIQQLLSLISKSGRETADENLVISHCNNYSLAEEVKKLIRERFQFKCIYIIPTGGLSSLYADDQGIVMAF